MKKQEVVIIFFVEQSVRFDLFALLVMKRAGPVSISAYVFRVRDESLAHIHLFSMVFSISCSFSPNVLKFSMDFLNNWEVDHRVENHNNFSSTTDMIAQEVTGLRLYARTYQFNRVSDLFPKDVMVSSLTSSPNPFRRTWLSELKIGCAIFFYWSFLNFGSYLALGYCFLASLCKNVSPFLWAVSGELSHFLGTRMSLVQQREGEIAMRSNSVSQGGRPACHDTGWFEDLGDKKSSNLKDVYWEDKCVQLHWN